MAKFTSTSNHNIALKQIQLPKGGSRRLHLVGVKARSAADIKLASDSESVKVTLKSSPFDGPRGIWVVSVVGDSLGSVKVSAQHQNVPVAEIEITVFNKVNIVLPAINTEHGMLVRLLLAESINPGASTIYDAGESLKAMQWMRLVIRNRLNHPNPAIFAAEKVKGQEEYTLTDIIKAKGQFRGFENYPTLDSHIVINLNAFLGVANNYNHPKREDYSEFIENAVYVAGKDGLKNVTDPSKNGLYGWRTKGSSTPGGDFEKFTDLAGQTFYTL